MAEDKTTVIKTGNSGAGGWFIATILAVVIIIGGFYLYNGGFSNDKTLDVEITLPKVN